jgi:hypothetical protein
MRASVYNVLVCPLTELMEKAHGKAGGRTKQKVARVELSQLDLGIEHEEALKKCKDALINAGRPWSAN